MLITTLMLITMIIIKVFTWGDHLSLKDLLQLKFRKKMKDDHLFRQHSLIAFRSPEGITNSS